MKKLITLIIVAMIFACNTNNNSESDKSLHPETIQEEAKKETSSIATKKSSIPFSMYISSLEKSNAQNPIEEFQSNASSKANEVLELTKSNIQNVLAKAKEHKSCVITVGNHTIVQINDISNCKQSGAWGACMPYATGYIKKGKLQPQADYINNIIGLPDSQVRKVYLFK